MDQTETSFCLNAFEKSLSSPVGAVISQYFQSLSQPSDDINLMRIHEKLINGGYQSVESFMNDLKNVTVQACRFFGYDSDISIGILSFQHSVIDQISPILKSKKYSQEKNNENWTNSVSNLLNRLNQAKEQVPNNVEEFSKFIVPIERKEYVENENYHLFPSPQIKQRTENLNLIELKAKIERFIDDSDNYELLDIVEHYQPELSNIVGNIRFDLKDLNPHTLHLIDEFVKTRTLNPESTQPAATATRTSSSTIILPNPLHRRNQQLKQEQVVNQLPRISISESLQSQALQKIQQTSQQNISQSVMSNIFVHPSPKTMQIQPESLPASPSIPKNSNINDPPKTLSPINENSTLESPMQKSDNHDFTLNPLPIGSQTENNENDQKPIEKQNDVVNNPEKPNTTDIIVKEEQIQNDNNENNANQNEENDSNKAVENDVNKHNQDTSEEIKENKPSTEEHSTDGNNDSKQ